MCNFLHPVTTLAEFKYPSHHLRVHLSSYKPSLYYRKQQTNNNVNNNNNNNNRSEEELRNEIRIVKQLPTI
jgi:hypothetical protein